MQPTTLTISSKNYSSWSLRGWLMTKLSGIDFEEIVVDPDDAAARAEILLLSPSILVPCLTYKGTKIWDTLAIGEFLNEIAPKATLLPTDRIRRARCRSICGEVHSGFTSLRSALPMNLKAHFPNFKVWSKAQGDIARVTQIWSECLDAYGGPYLFGTISMADAMYAPVAYCNQIFAWPAMQEWTTQAQLEKDEIEELEVEF
jgi:glutathione S-transferase